jgi:guanyl-specific ribonuclease Sa
MYYVEYTIERPGERKRHLLSVVGIGSNGWVNRLYTVSGQVHQLLSGPPQMRWINF